MQLTGGTGREISSVGILVFTRSQLPMNVTVDRTHTHALSSSTRPARDRLVHVFARDGENKHANQMVTTLVTILGRPKAHRGGVGGELLGSRRSQVASLSSGLHH